MGQRPRRCGSAESWGSSGGQWHHMEAVSPGARAQLLAVCVCCWLGLTTGGKALAGIAGEVRPGRHPGQGVCMHLDLG